MFLNVKRIIYLPPILTTQGMTEALNQKEANETHKHLQEPIPPFQRA